MILSNPYSIRKGNSFDPDVRNILLGVQRCDGGPVGSEVQLWYVIWLCNE